MATDRKGMDIYIRVNRIVLGWLAAVSREDPKFVMANLRDMGNAAVERLQSRNGTWGSTWTSVQYPGTDTKIRCTCKIDNNGDLMQAHRQQYEAQFAKEVGLTYPKRSRKKDFDYKVYQEKCNEYNNARQAWMNANPYPYRNFDYKCIMVEFDVKGRQSFVTMSQADIETFLVEDILLAPAEEDDDE